MIAKDGTQARPPVPQFRPEFARPDSSSIKMPDLRFSKIDLGSDLEAIGDTGWQKEPVPPANRQRGEQRKSRLGLFGGSNRNSAAASSDDLLGAPRSLASSQARASSTTNLASPMQYSPNSNTDPFAAYHSLPRSATTAVVDKHKVLESAAVAMNRQVPAKAPPKHSTNFQPPPIDKKVQKQREKQRMLLEKELALKEKERVKLIAKEEKEAAKREKVDIALQKRRSKADLASAKRKSEADAREAAKKKSENDLRDAALRKKEAEARDAAKKKSEANLREAAAKKKEADAREAIKKKSEADIRATMKKKSEADAREAANKKSEADLRDASRRAKEVETRESASNKKKSIEIDPRQAAKKKSMPGARDSVMAKSDASAREVVNKNGTGTHEVVTKKTELERSVAPRPISTSVLAATPSPVSASASPALDSSTKAHASEGKGASSSSLSTNSRKVSADRSPQSIKLATSDETQAESNQGMHPPPRSPARASVKADATKAKSPEERSFRFPPNNEDLSRPTNPKDWQARDNSQVHKPPMQAAQGDDGLRSAGKMSDDQMASRPNKLQTTSSSEGGTTSSTIGDGPRRSLETNTSYEDNSAYGSEENFEDARRSPVQPGPRPRRDEERHEHEQVRLSVALDNEVQHQRSDSKASQHSTFSAMLLASRPGGAADRAAEAKPAHTPEPDALPRPTAVQMAQEATQSAASAAFSVRPEPQTILRRIRERVPLALKRRSVQPELIVHGNGWRTHGVVDKERCQEYWRTVEETIKVSRAKQTPTEEEEEELSDKDAEAGEDAKNLTKKEPEIEYVDEKIEVRYNDLFNYLWTATTPDVSERVLAQLDVADIKALRQTSRDVRLAVTAQREYIVRRFLTPIGYRTWSPSKGTTTSSRARYTNQAGVNVTKDACPISFDDLEAFLISSDLLPEYSLVAKDFVANRHEMDRAIPQLARASTRAYNRVLTRLRLQPVYKLPANTKSPSIKSPSSPRAALKHDHAAITRQNSYYQLRKSSMPTDPFPSELHLNLQQSTLLDGKLPPLKLSSPLEDSKPLSPFSTSPLQSSPPSMSPVAASPTLPSMQANDEGTTIRKDANSVAAKSNIMPSASHSHDPSQPELVSPWKPGRAAHFRVWVPPQDPNGWLSDDELALCEQELYKAGIWNFLKRGDVVWDVAVGDKMNEGKYVFDGQYLRDLSFAYDVIGHLPAWLNVVQYSPFYWHNIIKSSTPQPVVHLDISPWREQILGSLRLVQDQVEASASGRARYRIAKWLYRSAANVASGQIISKMNGALEVVDEHWNGRIVIETEGTAEAAKLLVECCAGVDATPQAKTALLAKVMGNQDAADKMMNTYDTNRPAYYSSYTSHTNNLQGPSSHGQQNTAPWAIMRERSRPGLIWIR